MQSRRRGGQQPSGSSSLPRLTQRGKVAALHEGLYARPEHFIQRAEDTTVPSKFTLATAEARAYRGTIGHGGFGRTETTGINPKKRSARNFVWVPSCSWAICRIRSPSKSYEMPSRSPGGSSRAYVSR